MSDPPNVTADKVTQAYVALRDKRAELKRAFEAEDAKLKDQMNTLEIWLLKALDTLGADQLKTQHGTAYISTRDRAGCADWGTFYPWITETGRVDMLEKRVSTKPITEYLEENGELPPGINIQRERTIIVRR